MPHTHLTDDALLDVFASGFASGAASALIQETGRNEQWCKDHAMSMAGAMVDDPAVRNEALDAVHRLFDTGNPTDLTLQAVAR